MKVVAFVPIRLNSQRVEGKNLRLLAGEPLLCYILRTLRRVEAIDEVYVYCSDEAVRPYLPDGVRFLHRSPQLDRNETLGREIYDAFTAEVEADIYVLAHATSPFIRPATIAAALHKVTDAGGGLRLGLQRRAAANLRLVRGKTAQLFARCNPPHAGDRTRLYRDQRLLHLPARSVVRSAPAHRPSALYRRRGSHRGDRHRLSRRFRTGRSNRKQSGIQELTIHRCASLDEGPDSALRKVRRKQRAVLVSESPRDSFSG